MTKPILLWLLATAACGAGEPDHGTAREAAQLPATCVPGPAGACDAGDPWTCTPGGLVPAPGKGVVCGQVSPDQTQPTTLYCCLPIE